MSIEVGSVVEGTVTGITNFGAFVELPEGKTEVADEYVRDVHDFLQEDQKIQVKVLSIDAKGKIGLSIKALQTKKAEAGAAGGHGGFHAPRASRGGHDFHRGGRPTNAAFEDKLSRFLKDSDARLTDLRRKTDSKRGGRGSRRG